MYALVFLILVIVMMLVLFIYNKNEKEKMIEILESSGNVNQFVEEMKRRKMFAFVTRNDSVYDFDIATAYALTGNYSDAIPIMSNFTYPKNNKYYNTVYSNNMYYLSSNLDLNNKKYWLDQLKTNVLLLSKRYKIIHSFANYNIALYYLQEGDKLEANIYRIKIDDNIANKYLEPEMLFYRAYETDNMDERLNWLNLSLEKHKSILKKEIVRNRIEEEKRT